ncbi:hypothetical protein [Klebsiella grimontii]|uniref:hypothetical protein n=1 Tax=Klebsiella grimontii TaxID=2058152 RepID=UPI000DD4744E|nr:hypothetical protein [Klebsiella grimontii]
MTTDITELAQREKFEAWFKSSFHPDKTGPYIKDQLYFAWKAAGAEMVEALEKAQSQSSKWLEAYHKAVSIGARYEERIAELEEAERKLCAANVTLDARAEQAERERENWRTSFDNERLRADKLKAHIDEMTEERTASINELSRIIQREIKAKREAEKRIAELESRTVTVKLASRRLPSDYVDGEFGNDDLAAIHNACRLECKVSVEKYLSAHGIVVKWEDE